MAFTFGRSRRAMIIRDYPSTCCVCGKIALYYYADSGYCKAHKGLAEERWRMRAGLVHEQRRLKAVKVYEWDAKARAIDSLKQRSRDMKFKRRP